MLPFGQRFSLDFETPHNCYPEQSPIVILNTPPIVILNGVKDLSEALAEEFLPMLYYCPSGKDSSLRFGMTERGFWNNLQLSS